MHRFMTPKATIIAPSILAADFARLGEDARRAVSAGADWLHVDVMDGHFVPNLTIGPPVVRDLRRAVDVPLDVHLMIEEPDRYVDDFAKAGASVLTIHIEVVPQPRDLLRRIRSLGCRAGLTSNPATPAAAVLPFLEECDLFLCMTVVPGFGGQSFMESVMPKLREIAGYIEAEDLHIDVEVDGGIDRATARTTAAAGANVLVAGTSVFGADDMASAISALRAGAEEGRTQAADSP
jgi:ribulose-phosphate 3-epimerase